MAWSIMRTSWKLVERKICSPRPQDPAQPRPETRHQSGALNEFVLAECSTGASGAVPEENLKAAERDTTRPPEERPGLISRPQLLEV